MTMRILFMIAIVLMAAGLPLDVSVAHAAAPSGDFDVEQATRAYADLLSGPELEKSNSYFEGGYWLILWGALVGILVDCFLLQSRLSSRFSTWAQRGTKARWLQPAIFRICWRLHW